MFHGIGIVGLFSLRWWLAGVRCVLHCRSSVQYCVIVSFKYHVAIDSCDTNTVRLLDNVRTVDFDVYFFIA